MNDKKGTIRVRYDNGEEHNVDPEHVTPVEAPVEFGQEKTQLQVQSGHAVACALLGGVLVLILPWMRCERRKANSAKFTMHRSQTQEPGLGRLSSTTARRTRTR